MYRLSKVLLMVFCCTSVSLLPSNVSAAMTNAPSVDLTQSSSIERENAILSQQNSQQQIFIKKSQTRFWQLMSLFSALLVISGLLVVMVHRAKRNRVELEKLANIDSLTGLNNRRRVFELIDYQIDLANRHRFPLTLVIADLDHFKKINDQFGHAMGDKVLKGFGELCMATLRQTDIVGRIGGEEFILVFPMTDLQNSNTALENLSAKVCGLSDIFGTEGLQLSVSCGITIHENEMSLTDLMSQADRALYKAKKNGRNRIEVFEPGSLI